MLKIFNRGAAGMNILEQCRIGHENGEYQRIIDALEAIPAAERTPEKDSELARANFPVFRRDAAFL